MSKSTYQQLVDHFGNQAKTAEAIGVKQPTVSGYITGQWGMSPIVAKRAEIATGGAIRAADLCPKYKEFFELSA